MSNRTLTIKEVFPYSQRLEFLRRGTVEVANKVAGFLKGKTYQEWFEYFEEQNFQPNLREAPIMAKVLLALYQGMVLEAQDAANAWSTLSQDEHEYYKRTALELAKRNRISWSFRERVECAFGSFLVFHNFFRDFKIQEQLLDEFVAIIFKAVAIEKEISLDKQKNGDTFKVIETDKEEQDSQSNLSLVLKSIGKREREEALAIFNSMYIEIPESERERKNQELIELLRKWRKEDINE